MDTKTFTSAARRVVAEPIEFELDGDLYHWTPLSTTALVVSGLAGGSDQLKAQLNWLSAGLPEDEAKHLQDRLLDASDIIEVETLLEVITWLLEEMSGRPTGPSPA